MEILKFFVVIVVSYLLGSISVAVVITKGILKKDVREVGSGNAGATNVARMFGMGLGVLTLLGDLVKTAVSMLFGQFLLEETGFIAAAFACSIGHCWPIYFKFKGGKGVAVACAIAIMLDLRLFAILISIFILMFIATKIVSVSSMTAAVAFPIVMFWLGERSPLEMALGIYITVLILFLHRQNIKRLIQHTEPKFTMRKKKDM